MLVSNVSKKLRVKKRVLLFVLFFHLGLHALPPDIRSGCVSFASSTLLTDPCLPHSLIDSFFFTPDEAYAVKQVLVGLIDAEKCSIKAALFRLTDHDIAQALIDAYRRGVEVEVIVDSGALSLAQYSKVSALESNDIPIFIYQPIGLFSGRKIHTQRAKEMCYQAIMHHKTFIFSDTIGGSVVVCGSLNPTYAAFHGNEEMVIIRNNEALVVAWNKHFEKLKRRSLERTLCDVKGDVLKTKNTIKNKKNRSK